MSSSRDPESLKPEFLAKVRRWKAACTARGVDVLVYCYTRSPEEQADLYAQGRTRPGRIITNARPWQSAHNYGLAVDAVPMVNTKPDWSYSDVNGDKVPDEPWWAVMVEEAKRQGMEWAGDWVTFKEFVHFQDLGGLTIKQLYALEGPGARE